MPSSIDNVRIGVCSISLDGTDLGYTKGGVSVQISTETYRVTVDQFGMTAINDYVMGTNIQVTTPLAESTIENMAFVMADGTVVTDGVDATKKKVNVGSGVGVNLLAIAGELTLHPIGVADASQDLVLPKASASGQLDFAFQLDAERVFNAVWQGYPDANDILFIYGDKTATA